MKELLKQVAIADEQEFRHKVMEQLGWSTQVYRGRKSGRSSLTPAERVAIQSIIDKNFGVGNERLERK